LQEWVRLSQDAGQRLRFLVEDVRSGWVMGGVIDNAGGPVCSGIAIIVRTLRSADV